VKAQGVLSNIIRSEFGKSSRDHQSLYVSDEAANSCDVLSMEFECL
jgi:hypothetical protein